MIITCGQCRAKFKLDRERIKETGSKVRCSSCQYVFTVYRTPLAQPQTNKAGRPRQTVRHQLKQDEQSQPSGFAADSSFLNAAQQLSELNRQDNNLHNESNDDFEDEMQTTAGLKRKRPERRPLFADLEDDHIVQYDDDDDLDELFNDDFGSDEFAEAPKAALRRPPSSPAKAARGFDRAAKEFMDSGFIDTAEEADEDVPHGLGDNFDIEFNAGGLKAKKQDAAANDTHLRSNLSEHKKVQPAKDALVEAGLDFSVSDNSFEEKEKPYRSFQDDKTDHQNGFDVSSDDDMGLRTAEDGLGLGANPIEHNYPAPGAEHESALEDKEAGRKKAILILSLTIVAALLAIGIYVMASWPEKTALSGPEDGGTTQPRLPGETTMGAEQNGASGGNVNDDIKGANGIVFLSNSYHHSFRNNSKAGKLFIITGMVKNNYPERRSFIRLRGSLLSSNGQVLSESLFYAGNLISEGDLISLPMHEINARLALPGGQNGLNINIEPGKEIPFMVVFSKLPDGMDSYQLDAVSSAPGE